MLLCVVHHCVQLFKSDEGWLCDLPDSHRNGSFFVSDAVPYAFINIAIDTPIFGNVVLYAFVDTLGDAVVKSTFDSSINLLVNEFVGECGNVCVDLRDGLWHVCCKYVS